MPDCVDRRRDFGLYLEDQGRRDANDEEEGGHDEVRHRHPEPRRVVYPRPRPAGVVHEYHHLRKRKQTYKSRLARKSVEDTEKKPREEAGILLTATVRPRNTSSEATRGGFCCSGFGSVPGGCGSKAGSG